MVHSQATGRQSTHQPTAQTVIAAMFANQADWLIRNVSGAIHPPDAALPPGPGTLVLAGSHGVALAPVAPEAIDVGLAWLAGTASADVLVWSATEDAGADIHLLARGGRDSFRPRWMWRDLRAPLPAPRLDAEVDILIATERDREALRVAQNVPYVSRTTIDRILGLATEPESPRRAWMVIARQRRRFGDGAMVGVGILHLASGNGETTGGLYNLGVDPGWQGRGIGTALTLEICRIARDHGANRVALNATPSGERIYRQLDFAVAGDGQTWFFPGATLRNRPTAGVIAVAEASARGEIDSLDPTIAHWVQMPNSDSPIRFAARFGQRETIQWLLDHGAEPDIAPLWAMGFRDEAIQAAGDARWLNRQRGPEARTPLHDAICGNDPGLVKMLLAAGADLTLRDRQWHARPLDWANALGRPDLAAIILNAMRCDAMRER